MLSAIDNFLNFDWIQEGLDACIGLCTGLWRSVLWQSEAIVWVDASLTWSQLQAVGIFNFLIALGPVFGAAWIWADEP